MHALRAEHAFDGERFLPDGATVVIDGERIVGVEGRRHDLPAGLPVTDVGGTLLPGLIDCHTHLVADTSISGLERAGTMSKEDLDQVILSSLRSHAQAGVTTVRDLGDRAYRTLSFRDRPGLPRVVAAGPPLTTPAGHCHFLGGEVLGDPAAAVQDHAVHGVDVVKVMASGGFATPGSDQLGAQFTASDLRSMADAAHAAGLPLVAHAHSLVGARNAIEAGADGIEHFSCLASDGIAVGDDLLDDVARRGTAVDLTLGDDRSLHALIPAPPPPAVAALLDRLGVANFDEFYETRLAFLARLRSHGVRVIAGVDSGMAPWKKHGNVWRTVVEQVDAGYPIPEALRSATSLAAEACGVQHRTGRLKASLDADLLLVDGDLSRDVGVLATPSAIFIRGTAADASHS